MPTGAANDDGMRLDLDAAIGGPVVSGHDAGSVTTAVKVNGIDATLNTYATPASSSLCGEWATFRSRSTNKHEVQRQTATAIAERTSSRP